MTNDVVCRFMGFAMCAALAGCSVRPSKSAIRHVPSRDICRLDFGQSVERQGSQLVARFAATSGETIDLGVRSTDSTRLVTFLIDDADEPIAAASGTTSASLRTRAPHDGLYYVAVLDAGLRGTQFRVSLGHGERGRLW
jgi:hypothetical protein